MEFTRKEIALMQGALVLAMNAADNLASEAASSGDYHAVAGKPERAFAYHERARKLRAGSASMHQLFTRLVAEHGDLRKENQL